MKCFWRRNRLMDLKCHLKSVIDQVKWLFLTARVQSVLFNIRPFPSLSDRCVTAVACKGHPVALLSQWCMKPFWESSDFGLGLRKSRTVKSSGRMMVSERAFVSKSKTFHFMWKPFCVTRSHGIYITYTCRMKKHIRLRPAGPPNYLKPAVRE